MRAQQGRFVVQRHRARRLHYDLRLEMANRAPKHFDFEGVIPAGKHGGGDVIVWDRGSWQPAGTTDPAGAINNGELHFDLHGQKLAGRFVLVRHGHDRRGRDKWSLIHKNDEGAGTSRWDPPSPDELAALDDLGARGRWQIAGRGLALTNL